MNFLDYIQIANNAKAPAGQAFSAAVITNFTDDTLGKVLLGVCRHQNIPVTVTHAPYKQFAFLLKDRGSELWQKPKDLNFFFFDFNFFLHSEFSDSAEFGEQLIADIDAYAAATAGTI